MTNMEVKFLLNGQEKIIVVPDILLFYQEKRDDISIISVTKTLNAVTDFSEYLKEKKNLTQLDV